MLEMVDDYKEIKSYLDKIGIAVPTDRQLSKQMAQILTQELKDFPRQQQINYNTVRERTSFLRDDDLLEQYADAKITYNQLVNELGHTKASKYKKFINDAKDFRSSVEADDRDMKVYWITGKSGSGKTAFAKFLAHQHWTKDKIFLSSQGENKFDEYDLQECFILDEFRGSSMKFNDYLQLTDNHTNVKMGARYHNVNFRNCKELLITSIQLPKEVYANMLANSTSYDPTYQAYRRLNFQYYEVKHDGESTGGVYINQLSKDDCASVIKVTKIYDIKYDDNGRPEFIKLKEPIIISDTVYPFMEQ